MAMVRCRMLGHRFRFSSEGDTMRWSCQRECGAGGVKRYPTPEDAARYAGAFDREDREEDECYRAMDWLIEAAPQVEQEVFWSVATLLDLEAA